jgi:hypothetical protein
MRETDKIIYIFCDFNLFNFRIRFLASFRVKKMYQLWPVSQRLLNNRTLSYELIKTGEHNVLENIWPVLVRLQKRARGPSCW